MGELIRWLVANLPSSSVLYKNTEDTWTELLEAEMLRSRQINAGIRQYVSCSSPPNHANPWIA